MILNPSQTPRSSQATTLRASAEIPPQPMPKVKSGSQTSIPSYLTTAKPSTDSFLPSTDMRLANTDISALRNGATTAAILRNLSKASPDLSAAIFAGLRMAISPGYLVVARNLDGTLNEDGTRLAQQLCRRFDFLGPTLGGFNHMPTMRSSSESLGRELMLLGGAGLELILNKSRVPEGLQPISVEKVKWKYNGNKKVPYQIVGGEEISLDIPTFFYTSLDQDLTSPYSDSPVQSSIQPIIASQDFANDLRRVFRRAINPRLMATIAEESFRKNCPPAILHDPDKFKAYADATIAALKATYDGLQPSDALVCFDNIENSYLTGGNTSLSKEYDTFARILDGKLASGAKTMPTVLGSDSTANIASTQSMLWIKSIESSVQAKLNELYSRALTVAVRLFGVDAIVEFNYDRIDLRPESELEAYKAMKQDRVLTQLSLGLTSDAEASLIITGTLPLPGATPLAGTRFKDAKATDSSLGSPDSNTGAKERDLNPGTPKGKKAA